MLDELEVECPYCGARFVTLLDCSAGSARYIEDCQVCCAPINFDLRVDADSRLLECRLHRDDE